MLKENECILWQNTVDLAKDKGFEMSQRCPMVGVCDGSRCVYLAPPVQTADQSRNFYHRLGKHQTLTTSKTPEVLKKHIKRQ